jgi:hypothetical protein
MKISNGRLEAIDTVVAGALSTYQLTLGGLRFPLAGHVVFNALAALCLIGIGHPVTAAVAFVSYCAVDAVHQHLIGRWQKVSALTDEQAGFRQLAPLCALRVSVYLAPILMLALGGGTAEVLLFGVEVFTLLAVALSAGRPCC